MGRLTARTVSRAHVGEHFPKSSGFSVRIGKEPKFSEQCGNHCVATKLKLVLNRKTKSAQYHLSADAILSADEMNPQRL
jgi:hypothetical protein